MSVVYEFEDGKTMKREYDGPTPNGNRFAGRWVLRESDGELIDFSPYRNDLAEAHDLNLDRARVTGKE